MTEQEQKMNIGRGRILLAMIFLYAKKDCVCVGKEGHLITKKLRQERLMEKPLREKDKCKKIF